MVRSVAENERTKMGQGRPGCCRNAPDPLGEGHFLTLTFTTFEVPFFTAFAADDVGV